MAGKAVECCTLIGHFEVKLLGVRILGVRVTLLDTFRRGDSPAKNLSLFTEQREHGECPFTLPCVEVWVNVAGKALWVVMSSSVDLIPLFFI